MIKMQWLPLILNGKSTGQGVILFIWRDFFICVTYLFDLGLVLKFKFSFVIYIYILYFSRCFYPKRLTNKYIEAIKNQQKSNNMQVLY